MGDVNNRDDMDSEDNWKQTLKHEGYRLTAPREIILEIMRTAEHALSPIEVYDLGRDGYPGLGLETVYRTLEKLAELGLIERVHQPDGCHRYLRAAKGHQHMLVCSDCGRVTYFCGDDLKILFERVSGETGYQIGDHWLQLFGTCPECKDQSQNIT